MAAKDPESRYRAADRRLRDLLFGDGTYSAGIARGEENREQAARELRLMRKAFEEAVAQAVEGVEEAEARITDLEEELRRLAAASSRRTERRRQAS